MNALENNFILQNGPLESRVVFFFFLLFMVDTRWRYDDMLSKELCTVLFAIGVKSVRNFISPIL